MDVVNNVPASTDTSFRLTLTNGNAGWIIDQGYGITQSGEHLDFAGTTDGTDSH